MKTPIFQAPTFIVPSTNLVFPRLQPFQFWGTNLKGSNPISGTGSNLVSWGLLSSRAPTLYSKAPTLSLWGSNLQFYFVKISLVILHGSQSLLQRALIILVSTSHHQWQPFLLIRYHHCSSSYPNNFSKLPHDDITVSNDLHKSSICLRWATLVLHLL